MTQALTGETATIDFRDRNYFPLTYQLLFPHGAVCGWYPDMKSTTGHKISLTQWLTQLLVTEPTTFPEIGPFDERVPHRCLQLYRRPTAVLPRAQPRQIPDISTPCVCCCTCSSAAARQSQVHPTPPLHLRHGPSTLFTVIIPPNASQDCSPKSPAGVPIPSAISILTPVSPHPFVFLASFPLAVLLSWSFSDGFPCH